MNSNSERLDALLYAVEGIKTTPEIDYLLDVLARNLAPEQTVTLCDLFDRLRRGAIPVIDGSELDVLVSCPRTGQKFIGHDLDAANRAHDRYCWQCEQRSNGG